MNRQYMTRRQTGKIIITAVAAVCLVAIYVLIFMFSADSGEDSSAISVKVTKWLLNLYYKWFGAGNTSTEVVGAVFAWEGFVRKLAHFAEYMSIGLISCVIAVLWIDRMKRIAGILLVQLFLSAALDELHQYFVPGRNGSIKDVFLDMAGGILGAAIILVIYRLRKYKKTAD